MTPLFEQLQTTGLLLYTEGIPGVQVHHRGELVFQAKNKPQAHAFVEGVYWAMQHRDADRKPRPGGEGDPPSSR
jgi:hypothetical protein